MPELFEQVQAVEAVEFTREVQKGKKRSRGKEARRQFCSKRKAVRAMVQAQKRAKKHCRRGLQHEGKQRQNLQKASGAPGDGMAKWVCSPCKRTARQRSR